MKRKVFIFIILLTGSLLLHAQVSVSPDNAVPDISAMLDVKSTERGMFVPRLTGIQRDAIAGPANGLMIFCTDNSQYYFNKGTPAAKNWIMINSFWLPNGSGIHYSAGNIGVGTSNPHAPLQFTNNNVNRKLVLSDDNNNDNQFNGFGINGVALRYQVDGTTKSHVFYAGASGSTSAELLRIKGNGKVGIGYASPSFKLDIGNSVLGSASGNIVLWQRLSGQSLNKDQINIFQRRYAAGTDLSTAEIRIQKTVDVTDFHYISFKGASFPDDGFLTFGFGDSDQMLIESDGNIGIGTSNPAEPAMLDISSTSRGFLPPRMSTTEIALIQNPANGLIAYNVSDGHEYVYTSSGNLWKRIANDPEVIGKGCGILTDGYGHSYQTVIIGTQCWMAENLNSGTMINAPQAQSNNGIVEKYCWDNLAANCDIYGGYYEWDEMMNYSTSAGARGICPSGWHVPTDANWCTLFTFLDPTVNCATNNGSTGTNAGGSIKEPGLTHWRTPNTGATNISGFRALGANGFSDGFFLPLGNYAEFWSSTYAYVWTAGYNYPDITHHNEGFPSSRWSVRCVKN